MPKAKDALKLTGSWLMVSVLAASLMACGKKDAEQQKGFGPIPVSAVKVVAKDIPTTFEYMGQAAGSREVEVRARVGGILLKRNYTEGRAVKQGDVLFEIDPEPFRAAVEQAKGSLAVQEASFNRAKREYERVLPLFKENAVSQRDRDNALADYEGSKAAVEAARAQLKEAQINLGYTRVVAPISGLTSREAVSEGSLISTAGDASLLTKVSQINPIYVNFSISDNELLNFRKQIAAGKMRVPVGEHYEVEVRLADGTLYSQKGRINFHDNLIDPTTGTLNSRAELPNPKAEILPGQFVRVRLSGAVRVGAITVPQVAVLTTQQGKMVWVIKDGKATPRPVQVSGSEGDNFVVGGGLASGEQVIVDNIIKLRPGVPVKVNEVDPAKLAASQPKAQ